MSTAGTGASDAGAAGPSRRRPPLGPARRAVREFGLALITLGVIVLLFVVYQLYGTGITEAHNQHALARQFAAGISSHHARPATTIPTTTTPAASSATTATTTPDSPTISGVPVSEALPAVPPGGAVDHLVIPAIGVDKFVVEGTDENDLRRGPGHYTGTAYPGQAGNAAIAGHRTTYGAPFFRLDGLAPGDPIYITDLDDHTWVYRVSAEPRVVSPDDVAVLDPTDFAELTLTTCNPRFSATSRLIVVARLVGRAVPVTPPVTVTPPAPAARTATPAARASAGLAALPGADNLGQGESGAWGPAILYGLLVVAAWVAVRIWINRTRRWHRLGAYVVGIGLCLVPLWFCFENAVLLLPQSI